MKLPEEDCILSDVKRALQEDVGRGDVSAELLDASLWAEADIISREPMLLCGIPWAERVFKTINPNIELNWLAEEGQWLSAPQTLCKISGTAQDILTAERCALNFLQTLSGTATSTHHYLEQIKDTAARLLDTRKTIPGLRYAQKYAVRCAGGFNHRMGLYDAFLIKENHIKACGSIQRAVSQARQNHPHIWVEVEVETIEELQEALHARPDRILLDNFSLDLLKKAVDITRSQSKCQLEASGGIDLSTIRSVAETGVDYISTGALTKSVQAIDLSLLIRTIR